MSSESRYAGGHRAGRICRRVIGIAARAGGSIVADPLWRRAPMSRSCRRGCAVIVFHRLRALPDTRWNFWCFGLDITFFTVALNISSVYTIMPLFVHQLIAQNWPVALITTVRMFGLYSPALLSAGKVERLRRVKPAILVMTIFERIPYLMLALAVILLAHGNRVALLAIFFLMLLTMSIASGL